MLPAFKTDDLALRPVRIFNRDFFIESRSSVAVLLVQGCCKKKLNPQKVKHSNALAKLE